MKSSYTLLTLLLVSVSFYSFSQSESDIVITEIMYNQPGNDSLEYIELYNKGAVPVNLAGYSFTSGITHTFSGYTLNANSYVVVCKYPQFVNPFYGITSIGWTEGSLDNGGEKIVLKTPSGIIADSLEYEDGGPWPAGPDGTGPSLILCDPAKNNALGYNWSASGDFKGIFPTGSSNFILGSPGAGNSSCTAPGEVFPPRIRKAYAENLTTVKIKFDEPVQLSSSGNTANYTGLGTLSSAVRSASMDSVTLTLSTPLVLGDFYTLTVSNIADTAGNVITAPKTETIVFNNTIADLVITEILYDNFGNDTLEFVEVLNNGTSAAIAGGYKFTDGIDFTFPSMTINPGEYAIIVQYPVAFNAFFGTSANLQFSMRLDNSGEKLTLKNTTGDVIDSLTFKNTWQPLPVGASLVLCDPFSDNSKGINWSACGDYQGDFMGNPVWASPGTAATICNPLGINKRNNRENFISVYPNPAAGGFEISTDYPGKNKRVEILTTLGKVVYSINSSDTKIYIDRNAALQKGLYYVRVTDLSDNISGTVKLVIE